MLLNACRSRWEGTYDGNFGTSNPGIPGCANSANCSCTQANANVTDYSDSYKKFLSDYFIAQVILLIQELTCSGLALNVLGDGSIGIPSHNVF
jgi:hypothetical protein